MQEEIGSESFDSVSIEEPSGILLSKRYSNKEKGYSIDYPSNWNVYEYKSTGGTDLFGHFKTPAGNNDMSDLGIHVYEKKSETLEKFCQSYIAEMRESKLLSDVTIEKKMSFVYRNNNIFSFLLTAKSLGTYDSRVHLFVEKGNRIYHLRGLLSPKYPTETMQLYLEIMMTIQFVE